MVTRKEEPKSLSIELAINLIKQFEGLSLIVYYCPAGKKTIGYGHVLTETQEMVQVSKQMQISEAEAETLLEQDLAKTINTLHKYCNAPLSYPQEAALLSFIFNCGGGAFQASSLRQKLNRGEYGSAAGEFLRWVHAGGIKRSGLVKRRIAERNLFLADI